MSGSPGPPGGAFTKADMRPVRANCWRCKGLEKVYPYNSQGQARTCLVCNGIGTEMIPFTELFVHDPESRRCGFKSVKLWGRTR